MVVLSAAGSSDPDHPNSSLTVEWDLEGNSAFDTSATTNKTRDLMLAAAGVRRIVARMRDPAGAASVSAPIPLLTHQPLLWPAEVSEITNAVIAWASALGFVYQVQQSSDLSSWSNQLATPIVGDGGMQHSADALATTGPVFYRLTHALRGGP